MNNRKYNSKNPYQGNYKKVLCVCSAGLLRSPTTAFILSHAPYDYNTRAVGLDDSFALIPIDDILVFWADEIVCMDERQRLAIIDRFNPKCEVINLNIADNYEYRNENLIDIIKEKYNENR